MVQIMTLNPKYHIFTTLIIALTSLGQWAVCQNSDSLLRQMKGGNFAPDSSTVYQIPFNTNKKIRLIQGYQSIFSHRGEYASDFKVKRGTPICAARTGVVVAAKSDSKVGGLNRRYLNKGNHIIIRHPDSTYAAYWHLKYKGTEVEIGDSIDAGEVIGMSGNSGYSAFPHLHFMVYKWEPENGRITVPVRFKTQKGICYLRPGRRYCRPKNTIATTDNL
jgi:murein DD-endopeptidase MepM/ murein hydrolase activator NlpD